MSPDEGWWFGSGASGRAPPASAALGCKAPEAPLHVPFSAPSSIAHVPPGQSLSLAHSVVAVREGGLRQSFRFCRGAQAERLASAATRTTDPTVA
jgi:hypothetical protein